MSREVTFESILRRDNNWVLFKELYKDQLPEHIFQETEKMLACRTQDCGFATYICPHCGKIKVIHFSCKSKLCSCCGKKHTDIWSHAMAEKLLNCDHRHIVLTISDKLWPFFIHNPERQKLLLNSAAKIIKDIFSRKQSLTIGMVLVLHPFGDDLKQNFHVHAIVSCGGLSKNLSQFVPVDYIDYNVMRKTWQYTILSALREHSQNQDPKLNAIIDWCFKSLTNGFVIFADSIIKKNKKEVLRYIARYTKHPPISNRRIIDYDGSSVTFTYESKGEKLTKSLPKLEFILAVLQHTSSKHFKIIRRFGLYARNSSAKYHSTVSLLDPQIAFAFIKFNWRLNLTEYNGHDPLRCDSCNTELHLWSITYLDHAGLPKTIPKEEPWYNQLPFRSSQHVRENCQIHLYSMPY